VPDGQIQHSPAADRWELVAVPDQTHAQTETGGQLQQGAGCVLVEHPGLINQQQVSGDQPRRLPRRVGLNAAPATVGVPSVAPPMQQPGYRVRLDPHLVPTDLAATDLVGGDLGCLAGRGEHHHPVAF
jgi:hypothetical protein